MKMKKIIAGVAASALAVSAMAVATSAAGVVKSSLKYAMDDGKGNYAVYFIDDGENLYDVDLTKVASVEITLSNNAPEDGWVGGGIATNSDAGWNEIGQYTSASEADDPGKKFYDIKFGEATTLTFDLDGGFAADSTYAQVVIQSYCAAGIEVTVDNVVLKDADGNVVVNVATGETAAAAVTTPATSDDSATSEDPATSEAPATSAAGDVNQSTADKNSPDTGVEGVAVVVGLAVIAAGAVIVAKKRK